MELVLHFLRFAEAKLGLKREEFRVTIITPRAQSEVELKEKWSQKLGIPVGNFTGVPVHPRTNLEYAMVYINSVVLVALLKKLHEIAKPMLLSSEEFCSAYLRAMLAAEGSVVLKKTGVLFHVDLSAKGFEDIQFYKSCLERLGIMHGKYMVSDQKFPIYGYRNFERIRELGLHTLHPEKREKLEQGFVAYRRVNVLGGEEARRLILQQLASGPKTYDELAAALGKARTTIQAHHIPVLEKRGLIKRAGKRGQAWLWGLTTVGGPTVGQNLAAGSTS
jgi:hypothetical protein